MLLATDRPRKIALTLQIGCFELLRLIYHLKIAIFIWMFLLRLRLRKAKRPKDLVLYVGDKPYLLVLVILLVGCTDLLLLICQS